MTRTVSRAVPKVVRVEPEGFGHRVEVRCPCGTVQGWSFPDAGVDEVLDALRSRHRELAPLCPHRERRRPL